MRLNRAAGAALAAGALVAMAAPVAIAAPAADPAETSRASLFAHPSVARPGETVNLTLTCPPKAAETADGRSEAGEVAFGRPDRGVFRGTLRVHDRTKPGEYTVWARCSGSSGARAKAITTVTITRKPRGGTTGGVGGSQGVNTAQMAAGGALAAAAIGAGVFMIRRRRANDGRA